MGELRGDIDVVRSARQRVEIVWEARPIPGQTFVQGCARDVLHAFHDLDQAIPVFSADGCESDAAVAHDRGCHPMPA